MTRQRSRADWLTTTGSIVCLIVMVGAAWKGRWLWAVLFGLLSVGVQLLRLPLKKQIGFGLLAMLLSTAATLALVAGLDLYLHRRYANTGGYNIWGYRGPVAASKRPGERRMVMLGGSVAFGYGVSSDQTIPAKLEPLLQAARPQTPVSVVNLGWNSEGAYSFAFTLKDYAYLKYDAAILYSGYNDWMLNNQVYRHQSAIFRATGYLPIMPIVPLVDWLRVRDLSKRGDRVVFKPNLADRSSSEAAQTALRVSAALERQLDKLVPDQPPQATHTDGTCGDRWDYYCGCVQRGIDYALQQGAHVFVVSEPYATRTSKAGPAGHLAEGWKVHIEQQRTLANMLKVRYGQEKRVHYINMGPAVDLADPELCYDGLHLTAAGNRQLAEHLAPEILKAWAW